MANLFWLTDEQYAAVEAAIPRNRPGVKPTRNREVISGIIESNPTESGQVKR